MSKLVVFFVLAAQLFYVSTAADLCLGSVQGIVRVDRWNLTGGMEGIVVDLWINNFGFCYIDSVDIQISLPDGSSIQSIWGMTDEGTNTYKMHAAPSIPVGSAQGGTGGPFGFVATIPYTDAPIILTPTVLSSSCSYCPGSTSAPGSCAASVAVNERAGGSYEENGVTNRIWDLTFTNTGADHISDVQVSISPATGGLVTSNVWNLVKVANTTNLYTVNLNNALYSAGSQFSGAGFVVAGSSAAPAVSIEHTACQTSPN